MYHSADHLLEFYARIRKEAEAITSDFEIVFVNDGSPDDSLGVAVSLFEKDDKVRVVDLSRNFGHHKAIMAGLAHAIGERVFLIDCDLEEEPELLGEFSRELESSGADVVYGVQEHRKGSFFERVSGAVFYKLFNSISSCKIPANLTTVRLMSRRYVDSLLKHSESEIVLAGLWAITGFVQKPIGIIKHDKSVTTYSMARKIGIFVNSIASFSNRPLIYIFYVGFFILFFSGLYILYLIAIKIFFGITAPGYTSLVVSIWFLSGLTIFSLGVIGIYLAKVFIEVKRRPNTIVRAIYKKE